MPNIINYDFVVITLLSSTMYEITLLWSIVHYMIAIIDHKVQNSNNYYIIYKRITFIT